VDWFESIAERRGRRRQLTENGNVDGGRDLREGSDFGSTELRQHSGPIVMDEEIKSSLDALERRITATEKRFDDVKWYIGGASLIFSALTLVLGWNFSGDRKELRDAVTDMKTDVRELEDRLREQFGQAASPQLVLLGPDGTSLAGQQLQAEVKRENDATVQLSFPWALRNIGKGATGAVWMKLYTQKDMPTFAKSLDDPLYPYETRLEPGDLHPGNLPGNYALAYHWSFNPPAPSPGLHRALLRAFYGNGLISEAPFSLELK
jgi:hypothetical protein